MIAIVGVQGRHVLDGTGAVGSRQRGLDAGMRRQDRRAKTGKRKGSQGESSEMKT
jgi:hypothetical protein